MQEYEKKLQDMKNKQVGCTAWASQLFVVVLQDPSEQDTQEAAWHAVTGARIVAALGHGRRAC